MGILSEEQHAEFVSQLQASVDDAQEPQPDQQSVDSPDVNEAEDGPSTDAEDVKEAVETQASPEPEAPRVPEHIPYGRFKEVNDKYRAGAADLERAQGRIRELEQLTLARAQPEPQPEQKSSDDDEWLDRLFGEGDRAPQTDEAFKQVREEIQSVRAWQQQRTEQLVATQLEVEIRTAAEKNPDVKPEELWQAVAADGSADVDRVASYLQQQRSDMRTRFTTEATTEIEALKAQLAEAQKEAPATFRRPGKTSSAPAATKRPQTMAEASAAFAEALRERI